MNKETPINVLMIDDDSSFAASFRNQAAKFQVLITNVTNLEDGFKEYKKNSKKYVAMILDGKAPLNAQQASGTEKENFVQEAITKIREIEISTNTIIPFCVHTAWYLQLKESLEGRAVVFDKKKTSVDEIVMQELFQFLKSKVKQVPDQKIKKEHTAIFEFSDYFFDDQDKQILSEIIVSKTIQDPVQILSKLNLIRRLEESVYDILCEEFLELEPTSFGNEKQSRTKGIIEHLKSMNIVPKHINEFANTIYKVPSMYTAHKPAKIKKESLYVPNCYTLKTLSNALFEIIVWANDLINSK